jgi:urease accessory protein
MFDAARLEGEAGTSGADSRSGESACDADLQRAAGAARLVVSGSECGTRIVDVYQQSPLRILFPRVRGTAFEEAVVVNTAGGIAGGDRLELAVTAQAGASLTVTSQAAERVYRALSTPACVATKLKVHAGARLAWLPQETITYDGARLQRSTHIELSSTGELLALEWLVLGRAAHGEEMIAGHVSDAWRVMKDGRLIWADTFRVTDDVFSSLRSRALLADFGVIGTLIYLGPDIGSRLQLTRERALLPTGQCAATVIGDLLITRVAARTSGELKDGLRRLLVQFERPDRSCSFRFPRMWSA